jgi:hypothetical protein
MLPLKINPKKQFSEENKNYQAYENSFIRQ